MTTHSMLPFVLSADAHAHHFILNNSIDVPGAVFRSTPTPCVSYLEKTAFPQGGDVARSCMFCEQTLAHQDELGPHIMARHPTTFVEPGVLRVDAEFRMPVDWKRPPSTETCCSVVKYEEEEEEEGEDHRCIVCGLVTQNAAELESHMRKHKEYYGYRCEVCGRRFKQAWFLKNHIRMHTKVGGKGKAQQNHMDSPVTINGVIQDPQPEPVTSAYKMCKVCGFIFPDRDCLVEHGRIHNREREPDAGKGFLQALSLQPDGSTNVQPVRTSTWIPQLNPFTTYQAWQLATKGNVAFRHNATKGPGLEVSSTDQESSTSDKDDLPGNAFEDHDDKPEKRQLGRKRQAQPQLAAPPPPERRRRSLIQENKQRPTTCDDCQRTFRTYHQLVLHSRVHKKEKNGAEAPPPSLDAKQTRTSSPEQPEDGACEGSDDAMVTGEDGSYQSKRSKLCSFCGKSFKTSYYLTIHLRTHTGEKPYKCVHCNYAAAQKNSLKYHVERRHKGLTSLQSLTGPPSSSSSSPPMEDQHMDRVPASNRTEPWLPAVKAQGRSHVQVKTEREEFPSAATASSSSSPLSDCAAPLLYPFPTRSPAPVGLQTKQEDVKMEDVEEPLNLSLKVSFPNAASAEPAAALVLMACLFCPFKTLYPEVLITHKRLVHKMKLDRSRRGSVEVTRKQKRSTECPPALHGNDVTELLNVRNPRRTKSPCSQHEKAQEKAPVAPPEQPPERLPLPDVVQERVNPQPSHDASRKTSTGNQYVMERAGMVPRGGPMWHYLPTQLGPLPHVNFGESSTTKMKYSVPSAREAETSDQPGFRPAPVDGSNRLVLTARSVKTPVCGPGLGTAAEALQSTCAPVGAAMERSDWTMINFLHSVTPSDLAALYHRGQISSAPHGVLHPQRPAGSRTVLYQHLPTLPTMPTMPGMPSMPSMLGLQRRDPSASASYSNLR